MKQNLQRQSFRFQLMGWSLVSLTIIGVEVSLGNAGLAQSHQRAQTVRIRVQDVWQPVYQRLPNLPKENSYISQETGEVAENNTLVGRFIRYHLYIRGRSPQSRFDWKLTLADYLGINEGMTDIEYPSNSALKENPMVNDQKAIRSLSRTERRALVDTIFDLFNPHLSDLDSSQPTPLPSSSNSSEQSLPRSTPLPPQPQPGDANLLN